MLSKNVLLTIFIATLSTSSFASRLDSMNEFEWWRDWSEVIGDKTSKYGVTEGYSCKSLSSSSNDLSAEQIMMLSSEYHCADLVFYESFNKIYSVNYDNAYSPAKKEKALSKTNNQFRVNLNRWNILGDNIELDGYDSIWVKANDAVANNSSYGIRLGNGLAKGLTRSAKIQTRGALPLEKPGKYIVSIKFKESLYPSAKVLSPEFVGLRTKIYNSVDTNQIDDTQYIKADAYNAKESRWATVNYMYTINQPRDIYLEIEQAVTNTVDIGPFIGNVLVYRVE